MRVQSFSGGGVTVFNSLSYNSGFERDFCTWSDDLGLAVSGRSLQYPWQSLRRGGVQLDAGGIPIVVSRRRRAQVDVKRCDGTTHFMLRAVGLANEVVVEREDGTVLGRFPAIRKSVELDLQCMSDDERLMFLVVLGAGVIRRTRRFGFLARVWLPSTIERAW